MSLILALAAQVGAMVTPGAAPPLPHETQLPEKRPPRRGEVQPQPAPDAQPSQQKACLDLADQTPSEAVDLAEAWLAKAEGPEKAVAGECLGIALSRQERWDDAQAAFLAARDAATDKVLRARLGAMAGNAALARGDATTALTALDAAKADAGSDKVMAGGIAIDRARALVALKRNDEAAMALDEARADTPDNAQAWLLSATLSRRMNKLAQAQAQIEKAAALLPVDPEIGLEAGVIAVLAGHDEAARKSWQSVVAAAPQSDAAATARGYLAQLEPGAGSQPAGTQPAGAKP
jgi:tetratricopeptide (TPR) repeat protein